MKKLSRSKEFIVTPNGQWEFPGQNTLIPSNQITMKGVPYPVFGMDDTGYSQMMYPGTEYTFPGNMVYEIPMAQVGLQTGKENPPIYSRENYVKDIETNVDKILKNGTYITPYKTITRPDEKNCINGICYLTRKLTNDALNIDYISNPDFKDDLNKNNFYTTDLEDGFEIGDILQYYTRKGSTFSGFPGKVTPANANDPWPQHAISIVGKRKDNNGKTFIKIVNNRGTDVAKVEEISEIDLMKRAQEGYKHYDGLLINRYDPEKVQELNRIKKENADIFSGKNKYAKEYDNAIYTGAYKPKDIYGKTLGEDASSIEFRKIINELYPTLGKSSNMPKEQFDILMNYLYGIGMQESNWDNSIKKEIKDVIPESAYSTLRELTDSNEDDWRQDYWNKNVNNIKTKYKNIEEFKNAISEKKIDPEVSEYLRLNSPKSKGIFQQKEPSERGRYFNYGFDDTKSQIANAAALLIDNYHKIKKKFPNKPERELYQLAVLMHNSPSRALNPIYADYYPKNNDIDYFNKVEEKSAQPQLNSYRPLVKPQTITKSEKEKITKFLDQFKRTGGNVYSNSDTFNPETDEFIGFVDELPKAQFGIQKMYPDATLVNINLPQINSEDKFILQNNNPNIPKPNRDLFSELQYLDSEARSNYNDVMRKLDSWPKLSGKTINLTTDRYRGAKVPIEYIDMLKESANRFKIDPYILYAIAGRESTFGQDPNSSGRKASPINLVSGWNITESYKPYDFVRFLADNKTPHIKEHKTNFGINYYPNSFKYNEDGEIIIDSSEDLNNINDYINKNKLLNKYKNKLENNKKINYTNPFDFLAEFIINKGVEKYNPGDPDYRNKIDKEIRLLKMDPEFSKYVNQKAKGGLVKAQEGLENLTSLLTDNQKKLFEERGILNKAEQLYKKYPTGVKKYFPAWLQNNLDDSDSERLLNYSNILSDDSFEFERALANSDQWYNNWYEKRSQIEKFKNTSEERKNIANENSQNTIQTDKISDFFRNLDVDNLNEFPNNFFENDNRFNNDIGGYYVAESSKPDVIKDKIYMNMMPGQHLSSGLISYPKQSSKPGEKRNPWSTTYHHEALHKFDFNSPQKNTKNILTLEDWNSNEISDPLQKIISKDDILTDWRTNNGKDLYQYEPTEVRARLNVWRMLNDIDPLKNYTDKELKSIIDKDLQNPDLNSNIKDLYRTLRNDPKKLKFINDNYVSNQTKSQNIQYAANGGLVRAQNGKENKIPKTALTYNDNRAYFDSHAVLHDNPKYNEWIKKNIYEGKIAYDPTTGTSYPLNKKISIPEGRAERATAEYARKPVDERLRTNKDARKDAITQSMIDVGDNPLFYAPGAIAAGAVASSYLPAIGSTVMGGLNQSLPGMSGIAGATYGNLLGAYGATDAMVNRIPYIPGQLARGEYGDALANTLIGGLDIYGGNMISPLSKGAGTIFREQIYKAVDPVGYGVREKILMAPKNWVRNTFNPSERPERIGNQFNPWGGYSKDEVIQMGKNRLDAFRLGLNLEQDYNTFRNLGNNTYRINAMNPKEDLFNDLYSDILASEQNNRGFYFGEDPLINITNRNLAAKARIGISDPSARADYFRRIGNQNTPWQQTRIVERAKNPQFRHSIYDTDTQAIMGSYRWDVNKLNDGNIHFQSNDTWNLNPWENRGQVNLAQDTKSPNYRKWNPFSNIEALSLVGGKPFKIQNNFIVDPKTYKIIDSYKKGGSNLPSYQKKGQVTAKYLSPEELRDREVMQSSTTATNVPNIVRVQRDQIERPDVYAEQAKKYQAEIQAEKQRQLAYKNRSGVISGVKTSNPEAYAQEMAERKIAQDYQPLDEKVENYAYETAFALTPEMIPFLNTGRNGYKVMNQLVDEVPISRVSNNLNLERPIRDGSRNKSTLFKKRVDVDDENFKIDIGYRGRRESDKIIPKEINIKGKSGKWNISRNNDGTFSFHAAMSSPIESGKALKKLDELLPPKPVIHDQGSLSLDSYPLLLNMSRRSHWSPEFAGYTVLNKQHKHSNLFKGLEPEKSFLDMLESNTVYTFKDKTKANEAITRINELLKSKGFKEKAEVIENNETLSDLIKKTYSIKLPNYKFTRDYKQGGTYNSDTDEFLGFID